MAESCKRTPESSGAVSPLRREDVAAFSVAEALPRVTVVWAVAYLEGEVNCKSQWVVGRRLIQRRKRTSSAMGSLVACED